MLILLLTAACSRDRRYELEGQVLAVDPVKGELTVRHKDIKGFMPGMTMPFKVADTAALKERKPGDLIRATLVVSDSLGRLESIVRTGEAPLPDDYPPRPAVTILEPGAAIPDAALVDQDGRARRMSDWRGKTVAVTFIYTRCPLPDFCPVMDRHFAAAQRALAADPALASRVHLISVSFDPEFDTPQVLTAHAKRTGSDAALWTWLTGTREAIDALATPFGVTVMRGDKPGAEIVHNLRTAVVDREGRLVQYFSGTTWTPEELVAALRAADGR